MTLLLNIIYLACLGQYSLRADNPLPLEGRHYKKEQLFKRNCELEISCSVSETYLNDLNSTDYGNKNIKQFKEKLRHQNEKLQSREDNYSRIAFFVGLMDNVGPVLNHADVIFDKIITNEGSPYNEETGRVTAHVRGIYQFNVVISAQGKEKAAVMLLKNGEMMATIWSESVQYWSSASNTAILKLEKGDQVWIMLLNTASYLHGYMYTTFSGFLLA